MDYYIDLLISSYLKHIAVDPPATEDGQYGEYAWLM